LETDYFQTSAVCGFAEGLYFNAFICYPSDKTFQGNLVE